LGKLFGGIGILKNLTQLKTMMGQQLLAAQLTTSSIFSIPVLS